MKMMNVLQTCILISVVIAVSTIDEDRKVSLYRLHGILPEGEYTPLLHHYEILKNITNPRFTSVSLIRSYQRSFNGFAAYLSKEEQQKLAESESFSGEGLGPIPGRWKGECQGGTNFTCNRKIIGARYYGIEDSVKDKHGHGTHVASVIAGNHENKASYYGLAQGIARGGVPSARLAIYKACDAECEFRDILTAFDDAISDGVDVIYISIGHDDPLELTSDPIAISAFHAMQRGILTVNAAGNEGPSLYSVAAYAPWIFSVAASNTDRRIVNKLLLGDGTILMGSSVNAFPSSNEQPPLVYGKQVTSRCSEIEASHCIAGCLDSSLVEKKVVVCDVDGHTDIVKEAGANGCIVPDHGNFVSEVGPLPIATLNTDDISLVKTYQKSTKKPKVKIFKSEDIDNQVAPLVASFSFRGPSKFISDIIKPDITAPGVEILAAYSPMASPSHTAVDKSSVQYNILSGTSMACPHVAAAAAFVKSFHPDWSPSAIKSALMTTAWEMNPNRSSEAEFAYGSGHIDPHKAKDPGLVYDASNEDYHKIWCIISQSINASTCHANLTLRQLNYPSMAVQVDVNSPFVVSFPRTVTNVGRANSKYVASIKGGTKLDIIIDPDNLRFTELNQRKSFMVTVRGKGIESPLTVESVSLVWTDNIYSLHSPIVVYTGNTTSTREASASPMFCKNFVILFLSIFVAHCVYTI